MRVVKIYNLHRNDCTMDTQCEHCGSQYTDTSAYNDYNYTHNVIPGRYCKECDKNSKGEVNPELGYEPDPTDRYNAEDAS